MATATDAKRRDGSVPLIEGVNMRCPRCRVPNNILRFIPMRQIREFVAETMPVYKCPECRWVFAPAPHVLEDIRSMADTDDKVALSDDPEFSSLAEIHLTGTTTEEQEGFVVKDILRTGQWPVIPTRSGIVKQNLTIVRDGKSDKEKGIISLSELVENFKAGAIQNPQIPLSDDEDDHKNITATNTGFIRDIWIVDDADGISRLFAKMDFTEPEVKDKALRGTYADVSCGIPWEISSRGQKYGATLEHVAITNRPFIDGLGPFLMLSDQQQGDKEVVHFSTEAVVESLGNVDITPAVLDAQKILESANGQLHKTLGEGFEVGAITAAGFAVKNENLKMSWVIPFKIEDGNTILSPITEWEAIQTEGEADAPGEQTPPAPHQQQPPAPSSANLPSGPEGELEAARRLRAERLAASIQTTKEDHMPLSREELDRLDLSAMPEEQRAVFQKILDENATLDAKHREQSVDRRIVELSDDLGLKERPGFLKLYRQVALGDDGGPAVVVLSDSGQKESVSAKTILDRAIEALKGSDGKVVLSDQHLASGNDDKPPADAAGDKKPVADRVQAARDALGLGSKS